MSHLVYGIRHHGPGSAKSLLKALATQQPDLVLIEGPPDADAQIHYVQQAGLKPPVALLVYDPKDLGRASYFPFAAFSPEWQAMKYALAKGIGVQFMDLPIAIAAALDESETAALFDDPTTQDPEHQAIVQDPLHYLAQLAGFDDAERWWEMWVENREAQAEIFPEIITLMGALRQETVRAESRHTLLREAYMRKTIRKALKDGFKNIAVVCGAWHAPALAALNAVKPAADNAALKGLKKIKTEATWVPWTYERLSAQSGYGAGVLSPAWYDLLFSPKKDPLVRWMVKVAQLLRVAAMDASSAHVIEAVRLADTLATLRGLPMPGIGELREAAATIFGGGYDEVLQLIDNQLVIGDVMGKVPIEVPTIPLQADLEQQVKTTRLTEYYQIAEEQWLKATTQKPKGGLDLREPTDLGKSRLLHRLLLLGIDWGKKETLRSKNTLSNFHEYWRMRWKVGFALKIIEAGLWGSTVEEATTARVQATIKQATTLPDLTDLLENVLCADLNGAMPALVDRIHQIAAVSKDVQHLLQALPALVAGVRYGSIRRTDQAALLQLVRQIVPRILISLPHACASLNEEAARAMFDLVVAGNSAINRLQQPDLLGQWHDTLRTIAQANAVNGLLAGATTRILFDANQLTPDEAGDLMHYFLSTANDAAKAALWMEGFLHGSGLLLLHHPALWRILDEWVDGLSMETLQEVLPLLRRTFANFSPAERQKMLALAQHGSTSPHLTASMPTLDFDRANRVIPTLQQIFLEKS